jgi:hypothetical protein
VDRDATGDFTVVLNDALHEYDRFAVAGASRDEVDGNRPSRT